MYDVAIAGRASSPCRHRPACAYTRDGHFSLDANGQIVTTDGHPVQGDGGAITITPMTATSRSRPTAR